MERVLKLSVGVGAIMLAFMLVIPGIAGAVSCDNPITICGCVADQANTTYTLAADMNCTTRHGIIIGASGVTIDGNGFEVDGMSKVSRHCEVLMAAPDECALGPCRAAADTACGGVAGDCCIDSGIINARVDDPTVAGFQLVGGCNDSAPACQGGCDGVTVINVEIKRWCDGIYMSGSCSYGDQQCVGTTPPCTAVASQKVGTGVYSEYRLTGLLIEGCYINDNGKDCGDCDGSCCGHQYHRYNDGIFLSEVGVNSITDGSWANLPCGAPEGPCGVTGAAHADRNIVWHNKISNQQGCCCESCPGGNCINHNSGIEVREAEPCIGDAWYAGCDEIAKNVCKNTDCSCIQFHFGTDKNRIHGNYCMGNGYAGIASGCDWLNENYIYGNFIKDAGGPGIGVNAGAHIWNNFSLDNYDTNVLCANFPDEGYGILALAGASCVMHNTCIGNETADIADPFGAISVGDYNMCQTTGGGYTDATTGPNGKCRYDGGDRLNCKADMNHDCIVSQADKDIFQAEDGSASRVCCPSPW